MLNEFICIGLICIAVKSFYDAYTDPSKHIDLDNYPIFNYCVTKSQVSAKKQNAKEVKNKKNVSQYTSLQLDCFEALKSLGVKSQQERTFIIHNTFNKHNPQTVQEFLTLALIVG